MGRILEVDKLDYVSLNICILLHRPKPGKPHLKGMGSSFPVLPLNWEGRQAHHHLRISDSFDAGQDVLFGLVGLSLLRSSHVTQRG